MKKLKLALLFIFICVLAIILIFYLLLPKEECGLHSGDIEGAEMGILVSLLNAYHSAEKDYPKDTELRKVVKYCNSPLSEDDPFASLVHIGSNIYKFNKMKFSYTYISPNDFPNIKILEK